MLNLNKCLELYKSYIFLSTIILLTNKIQKSMQKTSKIQKDLFRFVTFRGVNLLSQKTRNLRFVFHPDLTKSVLLNQLGTKAKESDKNIQQVLSSYKAFENYQEVRNVHPNLFDFFDEVNKRKVKIQQLTELSKRKELLLTQKQILHLFDQLFYQVLTQKSNMVKQAISNLLLANHLVSNHNEISKSKIEKTNDVKIVIPKRLIKMLKLYRYPSCKTELYGVHNLGFADFRKIEQEVCCYVPGEVSHIENIMAREYKERSTRNLVRTEDTYEKTTEAEIENLSDVSTTTRNELSSEIASILDQERTSNYGGSFGVSGEYMGVTISADAHADFSNSNSSSYSNTEAKNYAEEVTNRAVEKIIQKTTEKRASKIIKEYEENNRHGFDNRNGDKHVTGVYRWLDIIYTNKMINYGKKLMIEFMLPEPAAFYKRALAYIPTETMPNNSGVNIEDNDTPKSLTDLGINSHTDITRENYNNLANEYGIRVTAPLDATKNITQSFAPVPPIKQSGDDWTHQFSINIEQDYQAESVNGTYSFRWKALSGEKAYFTFKIGSVTGGKTDLRGAQQTTNGTINGNLNPKVTNALPVQFTGDKLYTYGVTINVACKLSSSKFQEWQLNTYNQLLEAYNNLLEQYNNENISSSEVESTNSDTKSTNPAMHRSIEQRELKRMCIEMLMKPFCKEQGKDNFFDIDACNLYKIPQVNQNRAFELYASHVKFFEQAFDWKIMSYLFYPYYWADKCDWADLIQSESTDPIFEAFLQSGMARLIVPVRTEFSSAISYYMETGEIWNGGDLVPETDDELYLSIEEEIKTIEGYVEDEWQTRVPTSLAIIQGKSAYLDNEGLPCCDDINNSENSPSILPSSDVLQIIKS